MHRLSRPPPCVPHYQHSTSHFYSSEEQIVERSWRPIIDRWIEDGGQNDGGSFYRACHDVGPAICSAPQYEGQDNHCDRNFHEDCDTQPEHLGHMGTTGVSCVVQTQGIE